MPSSPSAPVADASTTETAPAGTPEGLRPGVTGKLRRRIPVRLRNLSLSGCLLETPAELAHETSGTLTLQVDDREYLDTIKVVRRAVGAEEDNPHISAAEFAWGNQPGSCSLRGLVPEPSRETSGRIVLPELRAERLVLWRLDGEGHKLRCTVEAHEGGLRLTVSDDATDTLVVEETHRQLDDAVRRAETMYDRCQDAGWQPPEK